MLSTNISVPNPGLVQDCLHPGQPVAGPTDNGVNLVARDFHSLDSFPGQQSCSSLMPLLAGNLHHGVADRGAMKSVAKCCCGLRLSELQDLVQGRLTVHTGCASLIQLLVSQGAAYLCPHAFAMQGEAIHEASNPLYLPLSDDISGIGSASGSGAKRRTYHRKGYEYKR
jgi:hypothetical protein